MLTARPDVIDVLLRRGPELADQLMSVVKRVVDSMVSISLTSSAQVGDSMIKQLSLQSNDPTLADLPARTANSRTEELVRTMIQMILIGGGRLEMPVPEVTDDQSWLAGGLSYLIACPPSLMDGETVRRILETILRRFMHVAIKQKGLGPNIILASGAGEQVKSENAFAGLTFEGGPLTNEVDPQAFAENTGSGPLTRLFKYAFGMPLGTLNFPGEPNIIGGVTIHAVYGDVSAFHLVMDFISALRHAQSGIGNAMNRTLDGLTRVFTTAGLNWHNYIAEFHKSIGPLQAMGYRATDPRVAALGSPLVRSYGYIDFIGLIAKSSNLQIDLSVDLYQAIDTARAFTADLDLIMATRKQVLRMITEGIEFFEGTVPGVIGFSRADRKAFVSQMVKKISPWLRLKSSVQWIEILKQADEDNHEHVDTFNDLIDEYYGEFLYGETVAKYFTDTIDVGSGQITATGPLDYAIISNGKPAIAKSEDDDLSGDLDIVMVKDVNDVANLQPPFSLRGSRFFAQIQPSVSTDLETSVDYSPNTFLDGIMSTATYTVPVRIGIRHKSVLSSQPRRNYGGTLVKVRKSGIKQLSEGDFEKVDSDIVSIVTENLKSVDIEIITF
jgi:hypothetical protein